MLSFGYNRDTQSRLSCVLTAGVSQHHKCIGKLDLAVARKDKKCSFHICMSFFVLFCWWIFGGVIW